jgi:hypothetical protein
MLKAGKPFRLTIRAAGELEDDEPAAEFHLFREENRTEAPFADLFNDIEAEEHLADARVRDGRITVVAGKEVGGNATELAWEGSVGVGRGAN